jgi:hypothetical protein
MLATRGCWSALRLGGDPLGSGTARWLAALPVPGGAVAAADDIATASLFDFRTLPSSYAAVLAVALAMVAARSRPPGGSQCTSPECT